MIQSGPTPDELKILELKGEVGPENPTFGWQQEADRKPDAVVFLIAFDIIRRVFRLFMSKTKCSSFSCSKLI